LSTPTSKTAHFSGSFATTANERSPFVAVCCAVATFQALQDPNVNAAAINANFAALLVLFNRRRFAILLTRSNLKLAVAHLYRDKITFISTKTRGAARTKRSVDKKFNENFSF
jgi:hypothetical protein